MKRRKPHSKLRIWLHKKVQAEVALRESEERFRLLVEGARDYAMFLLDPANCITFWSVGAERVFGWSEEEALGQSGAIIFTAEDRARGAVEREYHTALTQGRAEDRRWHKRKDGSLLFVDGLMIRLDGEDKALRGFVKIGRDVTAQHEAEEALRQAHDELEQRVQERTAELLYVSTARQDLLARLVTSQEDERRRIARELHDSLGQLLTALNLRLSLLQQRHPLPQAAVDELAQLRHFVIEIGEELDRMTLELRPPALEHLGLVEALRSYTREWTRTSGSAVDIYSYGMEGERLPAVIESTAYRIVQEALNNALKHAQSQRVSIIVRRSPGQFSLIIEDDGVGFTVEALPRGTSDGRQVGLIGMRERAALAGGSLMVESSPGAGTTIYLRIPIGDPQTAR